MTVNQSASTNVLIAVFCAWGFVIAGTRPAIGAIPDRLSDQEFWKLSESLSEPGASFGRAENLVSNEQTLPIMAGILKRWAGRNVYLGVGEEQNFSYIAAARPSMAFIVDIRPSIRSLHLLYKVLFELSADRGEFLS